MKRIESVDTLKLLAITAVIVIHTTPFEFSDWHESNIFSLATSINQISRFAVPFFFVISGYFWGVKINDGSHVVTTSISMAKRIAFVFIAWSLIYILPYNNFTAVFQHGWLWTIKFVYWNLMSLTDKPLYFLFQGTKGHLWFLVSLLSSLVINALFIARKRVRAMIACSVVLYLFGLLAKAYVDTPLGIHIEFNTRNGPFFGLLFFSSGYVLSRMSPNSGWFWKGVILVAFGYVTHFTELYLLHAYFGTSPFQDYVVGTYFIGLGCALVALSNPRFLRVQAFSDVGRLTLGIYAVHYIFVDILDPIKRSTSSPLWELGYVLSVLILSTVSVFFMSKSKVLRHIVV